MVDLRGCNAECRAEFLLLHIKNMPVTSGSDSGFSLFGSINDQLSAGKRGFDGLVKRVMDPKVQADELGDLYAVVAKTAGASCKDKGGITLCTTNAPLFGRGGTTIGDTYVTAPGDPDLVDAPKLRHERKHVKQWEKRGIKFAFDYYKEGLLDPCQNAYEKAAGFADGDYWQCVP
ncbi:hypothetical protein AB0N06_00200 [Streptomyces sp. NPDC051020]|uniref:hypothetical protein n=1 Tax=Streptomyces sp. NPDC051020 TaxID=3155409 RepID=UPI003428BF6F